MSFQLEKFSYRNIKPGQLYSDTKKTNVVNTSNTSIKQQNTNNNTEVETVDLSAETSNNTNSDSNPFSFLDKEFLKIRDKEITYASSVPLSEEYVKLQEFMSELDESESFCNEILDFYEKEFSRIEEIGVSAGIDDAYDNYEQMKMTVDGQVMQIVADYQNGIGVDDKKLQELGITKAELINMDFEKLLSLCKEKDSNIKYQYQSLADWKKEHLDNLVKDNSEFKNYEEYKTYKEELSNSILECKANLKQIEKMRKTAKYSVLETSKDYCDYEVKTNDINISNIEDSIEYIPSAVTYHGPDKKTISYSQYCKKYGEVSKFDFIKAVREKYPSVEITNIDEKDKLIDLIEASEVNPELEKMYKFLYEKEGEEAANQYLENMEETINQSLGAKNAQEFLDKLVNEENVGDALSNHLKVSGKGIGDGVESWANGITAWIESSDTYSAKEYETMYILDALKNNEKYDKLLDNNYEISQAIGNMLPSIAIGTLLTPTVGSISMGVSAGGNSYHSALVEGHSKATAFTYGTLSGLSESVLQKFLGAIPGLNNVKAKTFKEFAKAMVDEGIEEGTQEYIDALLKYGILDEDIDLAEVTKNAGKSYLYGSIIGGIMNGPSLTTNSISVSNNQNIEDILKKLKLKSAFGISNNGKYQIKNDNNYTSYNELIPEEFVTFEQGVELEKIFNNSDNIIGIHAAGTHSETVNKSILEKGIILTGDISSGVAPGNIDIENNIRLYEKKDKLHFATFLNNLAAAGGYKVNGNSGDGYIISIPKDKIKNVAAITYKGEDGQVYLKPEYIIADVTITDGVLENINYNDNANVMNSQATKQKGNGNFQLYSFFENLKNDYGVDQAAIENLCTYEYNGQKMNFRQVKD